MNFSVEEENLICMYHRGLILRVNNTVSLTMTHYF